MLYELPSKINLCKEIINIIKGRTLIFGNSLNSLNYITEYVISGRNSEIKNNAILSMFQNGEINIIGSFKILEQGANLNKINNIILHSYYGREKSFIQRLGRGRRDLDEPINLIIILTKQTQEEVWFRNMLSDSDIHQIWCSDINEFKQKYYGVK